RSDQYAIWCGLGSAGNEVTAAFVLGGKVLNAHTTKLDFQFEGFGPTQISYGSNWSYQNQNQSNLWTIPTAKVTPTALPLGDQKYTLNGSQKGSVYLCDERLVRRP